MKLSAEGVFGGVIFNNIELETNEDLPILAAQLVGGGKMARSKDIDSVAKENPPN